MISLIMPVLNEEKSLKSTLPLLFEIIKKTSYELIIVDGGSDDKTVNIAKKYGTVLQSQQGTNLQCNYGAQHAKGDIFFFVHADMTLSPKILSSIEEKIYKENYDGGGFSNVFSKYNKKIKLLGRILNFRFKDNDNEKNLIFFGDNGIFCKKEIFFKLGGYKNIPIMFDYDFSKRMRDSFNVVRILDPKIIVSPRRHIKAGFFKTRMQWIWVKKLYLLGVSPKILAKWYKNIR